MTGAATLIPATLAVALLAFMGPAQAETRTGASAFGDWRDDAPGVRRRFTLGDLPQPTPDKASANHATVAKSEEVLPKVPAGFSIERIASGIAGARVIRIAPNGDYFVADSLAGRILVLRPGGNDEMERSIFARGLTRPYGIAFYPSGPDPKWVYVANSNSVVRFPYANGDLVAKSGPEWIVKNIPSSHHWTRDIAFSPDDRTLFLSVGSGSNVAESIGQEPPGGLEAFAAAKPLGAAWGSEARRGDVLAFTPEGKDEAIFATGLRNCSGMTIQPASGALWCVVNERDALGDDIPFEFATRVEKGAFYGWPWYYSGGQEDPRHKGVRPDLAGKVAVPDVLIQPHSAPLNIAFYDGKSFPQDYRGDAFVALHGSWNRSARTGYKVVRLIFKDGKPTGEYEDFVTGFVLSDKDVWGRPVGVAVDRDGALLITEDGSGTIWRVTYSGG